MDFETFHENFNAVIKNMISACAGFTDEKYNSIYILCELNDLNTVGVTFFYRKKKRFLEEPEMKKKNGADITNELLQGALDIASLYKVFQNDIPFEVRITYDMKTKDSGKLHIDIKYSDDKSATEYELAEKWQDEILKSL